MKPDQLLTYAIRPTLEWMNEQVGDPDGFSKPGAAILLLATCAQESHCGEYLHQVNGPALSPMQIEPATLHLAHKWANNHGYGRLLPDQPDEGRLIYDLRYSITVARLLYYSWPDPLPAIDPVAMFGIYKKCYNSTQGAATLRQFKRNWRKYVRQVL